MPPVNQQALRYKEQGNAEFKKGNYGKAIEFYTYATELDPNNHIFFSNRATAYFTMGKFDKSLRDSNKAIQKNDQWWKGHKRKIECLIKLNRHQEAADHARGCVTQFPEKAEFATLLATAERTMRSSMSPAEWSKQLGNTAYQNGDQEGAIRHYSDAIGSVDRSTPEGKALAATLYCNRAACNRQLYMHDDVVADCTRAIKLDPSKTKAYIRRAQSYESLEKYQEALADFEQASLLGGGNVAMNGAARVRRGLRGH
jgi:stress-induced-phosphoprotein 1